MVIFIIVAVILYAVGFMLSFYQATTGKMPEITRDGSAMAAIIEIGLAIWGIFLLLN